MSIEESIQKILFNYTGLQVMKIQDFLLSEIDKENLQETINFVKSSNLEKQKKYQDILYTGDKYEGLFIEGNQYLIGNVENNVLVIDTIGEENGICQEQTIFCIPKDDFITLINNKREVLEWIKNRT